MITALMSSFGPLPVIYVMIILSWVRNDNLFELLKIIEFKNSEKITVSHSEFVAFKSFSAGPHCTEVAHAFYYIAPLLKVTLGLVSVCYIFAGIGYVSNLASTSFVEISFSSNLITSSRLFLSGNCTMLIFLALYWFGGMYKVVSQTPIGKKHPLSVAFFTYPMLQKK